MHSFLVCTTGKCAFLIDLCCLIHDCFSCFTYQNRPHFGTLNSVVVVVVVEDLFKFFRKGGRSMRMYIFCGKVGGGEAFVSIEKEGNNNISTVSLKWISIYG